MHWDGDRHDTESSWLNVDPVRLGDGTICHDVPSQVSTSVSTVSYGVVVPMSQ